jgi:CheY-like chemotaxis protein
MLHKSLPTEGAQAQAGQAQRMEIVGRLAGGIVHDFNNILTVITGTVEILAEAVADRPELAAVAGLIAEAAARGANLTSHLLSFARAQPSQPRDVDVNALVAEGTRLLRPILGEEIEIETIAGSNVSAAWVDPHQLMTLVLNLAILARDAMPEGGKLTFATGNAAAEGAREAREVAAADHVMISVSASCYGIFAGYQDRAFVELSVVQDCVKQAGGHVRVRCEAGRGTCVEIYLPKAAAGSAEEDAGKANAEGGHEAVLIVEDDALVRGYVVSQVQSLGYRTLAASNAGEALTIIDEREDIDLLFTDVMMPGPINGRQLAIEALQRRPLLKVLYTSAYSENILARDGRFDADALLLAKPYRKADLAKMIRTALAA